MRAGVPRVQCLRERLEESISTLGELEEMVTCFSNADKLREFLLFGEESFNLGIAVSYECIISIVDVRPFCLHSI